MSSLVQGFGDEVIGVFIALVVTGITYLLWISTRVRETPPVRSVILATRVTPGEAVRLAAESASRAGQSSSSSAEEVVDPQLQTVLDNIETTLEDPVVVNERSVPEGETPANVEQNEEAEAAPLVDPINIRLRCLDEITFEAETTKTETLSRFRRRCLDSRFNLNTGDKVRLIFNGKVLYRDDQVMDELKIYNECVVHCIVRRSTPSESEENVQGSRSNEMTQEFDLSSACFPLIGTLLFGGWGCLLIYSHYFSLASTTILVGLTVLFVASYFNSVLG